MICDFKRVSYFKNVQKGYTFAINCLLIELKRSHPYRSLPLTPAG